MADGEVRTLTPRADGAAVLGDDRGDGSDRRLLGVTIALQRAETAYFSVDTDRCSDIDDLMSV